MILCNIIEVKETESTNVYATELLKIKELHEGTVISAFRQSAGKGQGSNLWESEAGKNLTLSVILYPFFLPVEKQFKLNMAVSLGVCDMLEELINIDVKIKWPNDIYIGNKKVSGILIENAISGNKFLHSIIGIGININQRIFYSDAPNPVSLFNISGKEYDLKTCLELLSDKLDFRYSQLKNGDYEYIEMDYIARSYLLNKTASFLYKSKHITASIKGVSEYGKLLLENPCGNIFECDRNEIKYILS